MTPEERKAAAEATHKALQKRKMYKEKRADSEATAFTLEAIRRCIGYRRTRR